MELVERRDMEGVETREGGLEAEEGAGRTRPEDVRGIFSDAEGGRILLSDGWRDIGGLAVGVPPGTDPPLICSALFSYAAMAAALRSFSGEDGLILWEVGGDMGDEGLRWEVIGDIGGGG